MNKSRAGDVYLSKKVINFYLKIMDDKKRRSKWNVWLVVGVVVLIVLLVLWLTVADLFGDTDVNAYTPAVTQAVDLMRSLTASPVA